VLDIVAGMATGDGSVQVEANAKEVQFTLDATTVTGRLVEGRFPRWRDVVGEPEGDPMLLEVGELLASVRAAAIVTSEQSKGVDLVWTEDTLVISGRSSEYGESTVKCPLVVAGSTSTTKLDPRYLADFLRAIPADEEPQVDVYATDRESRVLLRCGPYTGVIMPLAKDG
jgi:DNA polymerase-3 subunit beta